MTEHVDSPAIETGAMFLPLLEELVELISVESWRDLWGFVETRSKRFTKVATHAAQVKELADEIGHASFSR
jgi:hypothetical protein